MSDDQAPEEWDDDEFEEIEVDTKSPEFRKAIAEIAKRCDAASINYEIQEHENDLDINIQVPSGRETRPIWISTTEEATRLLAIDFENYAYVAGYEGVWHKPSNSAEFMLTARMGFQIGGLSPCHT